jgi:hypothetical protein
VHWLAQQQPVVLCNLATSMDGSDGRHLKVQIKLPAFSRVSHLKVQISHFRNLALRALLVSLPRVQISQAIAGS